MKWDNFIISEYIDYLKEKYAEKFVNKYKISIQESIDNLSSEFTEGYCYCFASFLKDVIKEGKVYCNENAYHCVFVFNQFQYDINGMNIWDKNEYKYDSTDENSEFYYMVDMYGTTSLKKEKEFKDFYLRIFLVATKEFINLKTNINKYHL